MRYVRSHIGVSEKLGQFDRKKRIAQRRISSLDVRSAEIIRPMFKQSLEIAFQRSLAHLEGLDRTSVAATTDVQTLRSQIKKPLQDRGIPAEQVVSDLARDVEGGLIGSAGGRFYAWVI